jgi:hypothetical protein
VALDAQKALAAGDVGPVLKWIHAPAEKEIRDTFQRALRVRALGDEARTLADQYFLETLVRVHRAGEGAPYEGLKESATTPPEIVGADKALASGSIQPLSATLTGAIAQSLREKFESALRLRQHADRSPEDGREFVAAYVEYFHFVEAVAALTGGTGNAHEHAGDHGAH